MTHADLREALPALGSCPGKPLCDSRQLLCEDHRDVLAALVQAYERGVVDSKDEIRRILGIVDAALRGLVTTGAHHPPEDPDSEMYCRVLDGGKCAQCVGRAVLQELTRLQGMIA